MFSFRILPIAVSALLFSQTYLAAGSAFVPSANPVPDYPTGQLIPTAANAPVGRNFGPLFAAWSKRVMVDAYQQRHPGDPEILGFVRDAALLLQNGNEATKGELSRRAAQLNLEGTCDDPVVHFLAGLVSKDAAKREYFYRRSSDGLARSDYARFLLFMAAANLAKSMQDRNGNPVEIAAVDAKALEALRQGLDAESFHADESAALRWRLDAPSVDSLFTRKAEPLIDIFTKAKTMPDWVREFAKGRGYLAAAWQARSGGWASEVTEEGWRGWDRNLAKARQHFTKSWELNPRDPAAATYMIEVATGNGGDKKEMRLWFDRAVAAQMDYFDAYRLMIWGLRPRWHGSHEEMLAFGDELLRTGRFDTCVPFYYFKVVADVGSEGPDPREIYGRTEIAHNLKVALENYLAQQDSPLALTYAHTVSAVLDFKNGNLAAAKNHMATIQFKPDANVDAGLKKDLLQLMDSVAPPVNGMATGATNAGPSGF